MDLPVGPGLKEYHLYLFFGIHVQSLRTKFRFHIKPIFITREYPALPTLHPPPFSPDVSDRSRGPWGLNVPEKQNND